MMRNFRGGPFSHALHSKYRMLNILGTACVFFVVLQQTLRLFQRPKIIKPDTIPQKIWQSWKVDALHFEDRDLDRARTWARKNPNHRYELLTDNNAIPYVQQAFGCGPGGLCRPDIVNTYNALNDNLKIIQADLLRYIIMYVDGGLWADIDVEAIQSIRTFIPRALDQRDIDMVIGIETDEPDLASHPTLGSKAQSFCQWTFMCKPGLPVMMRLIENIMIWLHRLAAEQGKGVAELHLDFDEVLSGTGPSAFTKAILAEMSASTGENITWDDFHGLVDSEIVGGVLVLPSEAFAAGTGHSGSGNHRGARALVKHHFHASSWTNKHQRFKHPVYDEVERCNWDVDCVNLWDANVAFYDSLPEAEKLKMIELKRLDEAKAKKLEESKKTPPPPPPPAVAEQVPMGGGEEGKEGEMEKKKSDDSDTEKPRNEVKEKADEVEKTKADEGDKSSPPPFIQSPKEEEAASEGEKRKDDPFAIVDGKVIPAKAGGQMEPSKDDQALAPQPDEKKGDVDAKDGKAFSDTPKGDEDSRVESKGAAEEKQEQRNEGGKDVLQDPRTEIPLVAGGDQAAAVEVPAIRSEKEKDEPRKDEPEKDGLKKAEPNTDGPKSDEPAEVEPKEDEPRKTEDPTKEEEVPKEDDSSKEEEPMKEEELKQEAGPVQTNDERKGEEEPQKDSEPLRNELEGPQKEV